MANYSAPRGEIVNPHVVSLPQEPQPDFAAMRRALEAADLVAFPVGTPVEKTDGYEFPGVIIGVCVTRAGKLRYVVEHEHSLGMLHIFNERQLRARPATNLIGEESEESKNAQTA